ncbi:MAG: hypothetical protein ACR2GQ_10865 [Gemmatimonadota bacterium]
MSHIDEGVLHAHLDGALRPGQADWVVAEAHLDVCHDCRHRLADAREVRDGAAMLLAGASAKPLAMPSFQELAAAGAARRVDVAPPPVTAASRPRGPRWWNSPGKLAWAASLMLAVGAGWIGRQLTVEDGFDLPRASLQRDASAPSLEEAAGARENFGGYRIDPTARANEARQGGQDDPADAALRNESELQKEAAANRPDDADRDAAVNDEAPAPQAVAAAPQRRMAEDAEDAGEATDERARAQITGQEANRVAAKAESSALCYVAVVGGEAGARGLDDLAQNAAGADRDEAVDASLAMERIRLGADRTAGALVGGVAFVGYWADVGEDTIDVRLSDGQRQLAISLRPDGSAMYGTLTRAPAGRADAAGSDDADDEDGAEADVALGRAFADGEGQGLPIRLEAAACPTDP